MWNKTGLLFALVVSNLAFGQPQGEKLYGQFWPAKSILYSDDYIVYQYKDAHVYWQKDPLQSAMQKKPVPRCDSVIHTSVFVDKRPDTFYTRKDLWNQFRPITQDILDRHCKGVKTLFPGKDFKNVNMKLFFSNIFVRDNSVYIGKPQHHDQLFPFAVAWFKFNQPGRDDFDVFGPNIFGEAGKGSRDSEHFYAANQSWGRDKSIEEIRKDYTNFPIYNYMASLKAVVKYKALVEKRREEDNKLLAEAMLVGLSMMFDGSGSSASKCLAGDSVGCVQDVPIILIK